MKRTESTSSNQGISTGDPAFTTTIVRLAALATVETSSSWPSGSEMSLRSWPSDSISAVVPTKTIARSDSAAREAAAAISSAWVRDGSRKPM